MASSPQGRTTRRRSRDPLRRRNQTVAANLSLVDGLARRYAACTAEQRDDLQQVGALGLIRAAERYDRASAVPFAVFARAHIRGAMLHYLRDLAPTIRPSRRLQELRSRLNKRAGSQPQDGCLGLSPGQVQDLQQWQNLSQLLPLDRAAPVAAGSPDLLETSGPDRDEVLGALQQLAQRQRLVVEAVLLQGTSLRAVGATLGISASTAHRLLHSGLEELRRRLNPAFGAPTC